MTLRVAQIKNEETYLWLLEKHYAKRIPQKLAYQAYCNKAKELHGEFVRLT